MGVEADVLKVLHSYGFRIRSDKTKLDAVGEPGCGQGWKLRLNIVAEKAIFPAGSCEA